MASSDKATVNLRRSPRLQAQSRSTSTKATTTTPESKNAKPKKPTKTKKPTQKTASKASSSSSQTTTTPTTKRKGTKTNTQTSHTKRSRRTTTTTPSSPKTVTPNLTQSPSPSSSPSSTTTLPRTREIQLLTQNPKLRTIGVDEAGRGPLAGPVVCAAVYLPTTVPGINDSKQLSKEAVREELYERIVSSPGVKWAVAVWDNRRIDEVNVLRSVMEGMACAVRWVVGRSEEEEEEEGGIKGLVIKREDVASASVDGCYIVCGENDTEGRSVVVDPPLSIPSESIDTDTADPKHSYYALIDGNQLPPSLPCPSETLIKGDSREYSIAAASILAKVTRDRLMHQYDAEYPVYGLGGHKGYPTSKHRAVVREIGASPIHRRTFAPLKNMVFDGDGKVLEDYN